MALDLMPFLNGEIYSTIDPGNLTKIVESHDFKHTEDRIYPDKAFAGLNCEVPGLRALAYAEVYDTQVNPPDWETMNNPHQPWWNRLDIEPRFDAKSSINICIPLEYVCGRPRSDPDWRAMRDFTNSTIRMVVAELRAKKHEAECYLCRP